MLAFGRAIRMSICKYLSNQGSERPSSRVGNLLMCAQAGVGVDPSGSVVRAGLADIAIRDSRHFGAIPVAICRFVRCAPTELARGFGR